MMPTYYAKMEAEIASLKSSLRAVEAERDEWIEAAIKQQRRCRAAEAREKQLRAALERIANPSTTAGMHYQDRDGRLQEIARSALASKEGGE